MINEDKAKAIIGCTIHCSNCKRAEKNGYCVSFNILMKMAKWKDKCFIAQLDFMQEQVKKYLKERDSYGAMVKDHYETNERLSCKLDKLRLEFKDLKQDILTLVNLIPCNEENKSIINDIKNLLK